MAFHPFLFLSVMSAVWAKFTDCYMNVNLHVYLYILMAQTLLCILASYYFSVLAFCCFILYVLPYGVIINNNKIIIIIIMNDPRAAGRCGLYGRF